MRDWICEKCGHEVVAKDRPAPIKWSDGHVCHFTLNENFCPKCGQHWVVHESDGSCIQD